MENLQRNELEIELAGQKILLRPTFENIQRMEADIGSVSFLGWKFSQSLTNGKNVPGVCEVAMVIFHNQIAVKPEDPTKKFYSKEEIWDMVLETGTLNCVLPVTKFLTRMMTGDKTQVEPSERQKKS